MASQDPHGGRTPTNMRGLEVRKEFSKFVRHYLSENSSAVVLLGDISVGLFIEKDDNLLNQVFNLGIAEQAMMSFAAGLSREGFLPFVHTISPFIIERAFEQLKLDLAYNKSKCIMVSANGPYDYDKLGPTHHCASDIPLVDLLPEVRYALPGRVCDVATVLQWAIAQNTSSYVRLTRYASEGVDLTAGQIQKHSQSRSQRLNIFVGEGLFQYASNASLRQHDSLYVWAVHQIYEVSFSDYCEIHVWEPYSVGIIANHIITEISCECELYSYTYPKSIEDGIYSSPFYYKRQIK